MKGKFSSFYLYVYVHLVQDIYIYTYTNVKENGMSCREEISFGSGGW